MTALLFGSISSVADTSELQREAFNRAFADHGLDWRWDREEYRRMLGQAGGRDRVAGYAAERGEDVDADAVHATKSRRFQDALAAASLTPRPGVTEVVTEARRAGWKVAFVTSTSHANVEALLTAVAADLPAGTFDLVVDTSEVDEPKPEPAAYTTALASLGERAGACVAVEDNPDGARAAVAAGVACVAFPNENTADAEFPASARGVRHLVFDDLRSLASDA